MKKYKSLYENRKSEYIIYLDMDGILTDFQKHFEDYFGIKIWHGQTHTPVKEVYNKISSVPNWWASMPWMKYGKELLNLSNELCDNVELLTTPAETVETCEEDKLTWVKREIPFNIKVNFSSSKEDYANPKSILVDDTEKNIEKFIEKKGIGLYYNIQDDNFEEVKNKLKEIF